MQHGELPRPRCATAVDAGCLQTSPAAYGEQVDSPQQQSYTAQQQHQKHCWVLQTGPYNTVEFEPDVLPPLILLARQEDVQAAHQLLQHSSSCCPKNSSRLLITGSTAVPFAGRAVA